VGDWVEVSCDYSPGVCSEGGTGVVIAKFEGTYHLLQCPMKTKHKLNSFQGLVTVKYIYGPSNAGATQDDVIGSSISGLD
jgi:hypothetical protein